MASFWPSGLLNVEFPAKQSQTKACRSHQYIIASQRNGQQPMSNDVLKCHDEQCCRGEQMDQMDFEEQLLALGTSGHGRNIVCELPI